jgi:hypothetical protein
MLVGWFAEIPKSLRDKFDELYPGRRNKKILTITAVQHAIAMHPKSLYNLYRGGRRINDLESSSGHDEGDSSEFTGREEIGTECGEFVLKFRAAS